MKRIIAASFIAGAAVGLASPAHADEVFNICPSGQDGVATTVTSCGFADNVRWAYFHQYGPIVDAYSPATQQVYSMQCAAGFVSRLNTGVTVTSVRCVGGNDAVVILW